MRTPYKELKLGCPREKIVKLLDKNLKFDFFQLNFGHEKEYTIFFLVNTLVEDSDEKTIFKISLLEMYKDSLQMPTAQFLELSLLKVRFCQFLF